MPGPWLPLPPEAGLLAGNGNIALRLGTRDGKSSAFLSLGAPPLKGATMFGAHDPRGGAGLAVPVN